MLLWIGILQWGLACLTFAYNKLDENMSWFGVESSVVRGTLTDKQQLVTFCLGCCRQLTVFSQTFMPSGLYLVVLVTKFALFSFMLN